MFIKGNEMDFKASHYSIADRWHIDEGCKDSISVNIEHNGDVVNVTPCEYDGSAYVIADSIGVVKGEIALIRMLFIRYDKVLYIVDRGKLAYRDGDKAYVIDSSGNVKELSEKEQEKKVYWYDCERSVYKCAKTYIERQCKMDDKTVDKYLFNFVITFSLKYEDDCATTRYYKIDDSMTREYGVYYLKKSDLIIDNSKEEAEEAAYISGDTLDEEYDTDDEENNIDEILEDDEDEDVFTDESEESESEDDDDFDIDDDSEDNEF